MNKIKSFLKILTLYLEIYKLCKNSFQIIIIISDNRGQWQLIMDNYFKDWSVDLHVLHGSYTAAFVKHKYFRCKSIK